MEQRFLATTNSKHGVGEQRGRGGEGESREGGGGEGKGEER